MRGPFLGCWSWGGDIGAWRVELTLWPEPRFWQWRLLRYPPLCRGFSLSVGPLRLEVAG